MNSATSARVLVMEDDPETAAVLQLYLEDAGYEVLLAERGDRGLELARERSPDVILLDLMLPGLDGWTVCKELRLESDVPILMLTARTQEAERLRGFELGVDDYIAKPFSPREVIHRVRAVLRRTAPVDRTSVMKFAELELDGKRRSFHLNGRAVTLTATEFEILSVLMSSPRRVFSREQLVGHLGREFEGQIRTVDAHVGNLRRKLAGDTSCSIRTVIGVGYALENDRDAS
ncbi:MAG: two-component system alkaline phosphatase synthesis response regulator PhoP [Candidatus Paceibacteria bacterium]|jgi:two-component system alkaline phosphatase synthesis response regulator PhoP